MLTVWLLIFIGLGELVDYLSTRRALSRGAHEVNPVVHSLGLIPTKLLSWASLFIVCRVVAIVAGSKVALGLAALILTFYSLMAIWNLHQSQS